ncbi:MAG: histidinol-phosphate transaminase [Melioribacteraceae bacterium]|nr:histidinol-phosphate transaminase [Melioribacteraceae bacterium]
MEINSLVRENIKKLKPYTSARQGYLSGILLDANENSFGSVVESDLQLNRYPDPNQNILRDKLSNYLKIKKENLFVGVGSDEIIDLLVRIFCEPKIDNVIITEPTYGMYKVACDISNVETKTVPLNNEFQLDINSIKNSVDENTKLVFCCSPNNPTGNLLYKKDILETAKSINGLLIVDEAYVDFMESGSSIDLINEQNNIIVMRTFSKAWGLAGIRAGYCIADKSIIDYLFKIKSPYNLNKMTSDIILSALDNIEKKNYFIEQINQQKELLINQLKKNKYVEMIFPSDANFVLVKFKNGKYLYDELVKKGIILRDRSGQLNLQNCIRITIGNEEENNILIKELERFNEENIY